MADLEYDCTKCGDIYIDDEKGTTHLIRFDEDGNEIECGGTGVVYRELPTTFRNVFMGVKK